MSEKIISDGRGIDGVEAYLDNWYKPDRYKGRGPKYAKALLLSYQKQFREEGKCTTSHHDSICGMWTEYRG